MQWLHAIQGAADPSAWTIHGPMQVDGIFQGSGVPYRSSHRLSLDTELRFHLASDVHRFVTGLLDGNPPDENATLATALEQQGYHLRITTDLNAAKQYLSERYAEAPEARYGLLASSKDRDLEGLGIPNDFQSTKRIQFGPWYGDAEIDPGGRSCRHLRDCVTEFGAQGLELDAVLLAWGTDLIPQVARFSGSLRLSQQ